MEILSHNRDKTERRFVGEAVYGIMASQSVMLTEIGRQQDSSIQFKKIEERSSRQLLKTIDQVGQAVQNRGIWVIDRGGDYPIC